MKTAEIKINDVTYILEALNAHDASFLAVQFMPILLSLQTALSSTDGGQGLSSALGSLTKEKYNDIVFSLFENIKRREQNALCKIFENGMFIYADINQDAYIYMSLLKEAFMLSFGDFLASAARAFPGVATALSATSITPA